MAGGSEQLGKGRVWEEGDTAGWQDSCRVQLPALPEDAHWAKRNAAQEPPAQPWRMQIPVQHLCVRGGKAGGQVDDSAKSLQHGWRQS